MLSAKLAVNDEHGFNTYSETVIYQLQQKMRSKPGLEFCALIDLSSKLEDLIYSECHKDAHLESNVGLYTDGIAMVNYQEKCTQLLQNVEAKVLNWRKLYDEFKGNAAPFYKELSKSSDGKPPIARSAKKAPVKKDKVPRVIKLKAPKINKGISVVHPIVPRTDSINSLANFPMTIDQSMDTITNIMNIDSVEDDDTMDLFDVTDLKNDTFNKVSPASHVVGGAAGAAAVSRGATATTQSSLWNQTKLQVLASSQSMPAFNSREAADHHESRQSQSRQGQEMSSQSAPGAATPLSLLAEQHEKELERVREEQRSRERELERERLELETAREKARLERDNVTNIADLNNNLFDMMDDW